MKTLETYINEALLAKLKAWFNKVFKTQETLLKDNKPIALKIDTKNIKGTKKPCKLDDIIKNPEEMKIIQNTQIGFPLTADIIKQRNKYLRDNDNDKDYNVEVNRYFYVDGNNTYCLGYSMVDNTLQKIEGFANILDVDVLQSIENLTEVQKFVCDKIESDLKKLGKTGMLYSEIHPKLKPILIKNGFTTSNENKDWIIKKIK